MENLPKKIESAKVPDTIDGEYQVVASEKENIDIEYEYVRNNLVKIIEQAKTVTLKTSELAIGSEDPKAIDAYSSLIKNLTDINKELLSLRTTRNELLGTKSKSNGTNNIQNAVFVGSTQDLYEMMKNDSDSSSDSGK